MKHIKVTIFSIVATLMVVTSCSNNEPVTIEQQTTEESISIKAALNFMSNQFDASGNVLTSDNPAGNIVFDFCFDFIYPIEMSYNTGTTVTVNNLEELVEILISSTENLFIDGISFPFQVETYNEDSNALEIVTINNEDEFNSLLEACDFDADIDCICTEEYDPVCVDIADSNGEVFTISYPNACFAMCDGFTEEDFNDDCEEYYDDGLDNCFEFVYPITILLDDNETVTVNSNEELFNTAYGANYYDLVFPIDVLIENGTVVTINNYDELEELVETCFDDGYSDITCSLEDLSNSLVTCFWQIDFVDDDQFIYNFNSDGTYEVQSDDSFLTTGTWSLAAGNETFYLNLNAEAPEFNDEWVVTQCDVNDLELQSLIYTQAELYSIDCDDDNDDDSYDCSNEEGVQNLLTECPWVITFESETYFCFFNEDGSFQIVQDNNSETTGTWSIVTSNSTYAIVLTSEADQWNDEWTISNCDEETVNFESQEYPTSDINGVDCD